MRTTVNCQEQLSLTLNANALKGEVSYTFAVETETERTMDVFWATYNYIPGKDPGYW